MVDRFTDSLSIVHHIAHQMSRRGVDYDDLVQEGSIGLMRADETFDPERGCAFVLHASVAIRRAMTRAIQAQGRTIRIPHRRHGEPGLRGRQASLDEDRGGYTILDTLVSDGPSPEREVADAELAAQVDAALARLPDRQRQVIELRFGHSEATYAEAGTAIGMSRQGAQVAERAALEKLGKSLRGLAA